ncbi:MAG: carboxypeptidase-like regulatory domain-containing protein [Acidobacteria bacterium]|nr:carboxypeptidase-like regulatory domain-containing protein [Acidobacteriota bacterium]
MIPSSHRSVAASRRVFRLAVPLLLAFAASTVGAGLRAGPPDAASTSAATTASIEGRVLDRAGAPVAGATVRVGCADPAASATTDERGRFRAEGLAPGRVCLEATRAGFAPARLEDIVVTAGAARSVTLLAERGVALRGTVKGAGAPGPAVAGAEVALRCGAGDELLTETKSSEGGRYDLGTVPARGACRLTATHADQPPFVKALELSARETPLVVDIAFDPAAALTGRVVDGDGKPVKGAEVRVTDQLRGGDAAAERSAASDDKGAFRVGGLAASRYRVEVRPPDALVARREAVELARGRTLDLGTFRARPGLALSGTVTGDDGEPVEGITLRAFRRLGQGRALERRGTSDAEGRFRLGGLAEGRYDLDVDPKSAGSWLPAEREDLAVPGPPVELKLERGAVVRGTATGPDGTAPEGLAVRALAGGEARRRPAGRATIEDRAAGTFRIEGLPPGAVTLHAAARGLAPADSELLELDAGEERSGLVLRLARGLRLAGSVVSKDGGAPLAGATVEVEGAAAPDAAAVSGTDGRFALDGLAAGQVALTARHPDFAPATQVVVVGEDDPEPVRIALGAGATVEGTVAKAGGEPAAGVRVEAHGESPGGRDESLAGTLTGADGGYRLAHLPAGAGTVVRRGGTSTLDDEERRSVALADGATVRVDFVLGNRVEGTVRRGGLPVPGARVALSELAMPGEREGNRPSFDFQVQAGYTDAEGRYAIGGVRAGEKLLEVGAGRQQTRRVVTVADQPVTTLDVALPARLVTGTVVAKEDGQPIAGARVSSQPPGERRGNTSAMIRMTNSDDATGETADMTAGGGEEDETASDAAGRFELFVEDGPEVRVAAWARERRAASVELAAGSNEPVRLELGLEKRLVVAILGPDGRPPSPWAVCLMGAGSQMCNMGGSDRFEYELADWLAGAEMAVSSPGLALAVEKLGALEPGADGNVVREVRLVPAGALSVRLPAPKSFGLAELRPAGSDANWLGYFNATDQVSIVRGESEKEIRVAGLAPGRWTAVLSRGEERVPVELEVVAGQEAAVSLP